MDKQVFLDLVWRLEEILMEADYLRRQIGNCGGECNGYDGIDDEGLCPACSSIFEKAVAEDERLAENKEFDMVLKRLQQACEDDKTGEYERILKQSRDGDVFH